MYIMFGVRYFYFNPINFASINTIGGIYIFDYYCCEMGTSCFRLIPNFTISLL